MELTIENLKFEISKHPRRLLQDLRYLQMPL